MTDYLRVFLHTLPLVAETMCCTVCFIYLDDEVVLWLKMTHLVFNESYVYFFCRLVKYFYVLLTRHIIKHKNDMR